MDEPEAGWSSAHIVLAVEKQAPWGFAAYDKWGALQINCGYCPSSATLAEGGCLQRLAVRKKPGDAVLRQLYMLKYTSQRQIRGQKTSNLVSSATVN